MRLGYIGVKVDHFRAGNNPTPTTESTNRLPSKEVTVGHSQRTKTNLGFTSALGSSDIQPTSQPLFVSYTDGRGEENNRKQQHS